MSRQDISDIHAGVRGTLEQLAFLLLSKHVQSISCVTTIGWVEL